ncbi:sigma-70 family RNA polymerase sigma factor [Pseudomonas sp. 21LCFQ02]|uniref:sigma-70 family RNA polymerase sigma factor n=1 Tax=Pseudomonas sp. 21LCFQ02 TaxID=2957505 RepID=UPI00209AB198|nr:sigma-70 family RNA polymerase sigma factor [Pseudomonas sp. 21LCFQ02]MCO8170958.1 sigma-70 family RNA polymerase sigma factor [Pseudomonas sp. 21LCFQ02]
MEVDHKVRTLLIDQWFRNDYRWLRAWVRKDMDCPHSAEDIASETFVQILTLRDVPSVRTPRALLATIARRLMYEGWRRRDLEKSYLESLAYQDGGYHPSPEEQALILEALYAVDRLLDGLSPNAKSAFLYHQLDGLTYSEIARLLDVSPSRVQQYMAQVFKRIYLTVEQS